MQNSQITLALPARLPMWVAAVAIGLLIAAGTVQVVRAFAPNGLHAERGMIRRAADTGRSAQADAVAPPTEDPAASSMNPRRTSTWCADCGVVASMRQLAHSRHAGGSDRVVAKFAGGDSGATSDPAFPSANATTVDYEFTVRFRDGSAIVFNETTPRTWRPGSRVIVIGRADIAAD